MSADSAVIFLAPLVNVKAAAGVVRLPKLVTTSLKFPDVRLVMSMPSYSISEALNWTTRASMTTCAGS